jgi:hypothetical protein
MCVALRPPHGLQADDGSWRMQALTRKPTSSTLLLEGHLRTRGPPVSISRAFEHGFRLVGVGADGLEGAGSVDLQAEQQQRALSASVMHIEQF